MKSKTNYAAAILCASALSLARPAAATEGASSYYFPGANGTFATALPPAPGFMLANQTFYYDATVDRAVLGGRVDANLKIEAVYDYVSGLYTPKNPVLGGTFQAGVAVPVAHVKLDASLEAAGTSRSVSDKDSNLGDIILIPASCYWGSGNFLFKLAESVIAPSGHYDADNAANVGRNYWGFDTTATASWFNQKTGTELAVIPGIEFNTENPDTNYKSGDEFHVDFMANQFLAETFAVGAQGYYYQQLTGDSGEGAALGDFKGESLGFGPALLWLPAAGKGKLSIVGKWLHDVQADNRIEADYGQFTVACAF